MKGVVLAAGKGTRLYPVTLAIPKPVLPLGNRMTIEYAFDILKSLGITEICVVVGENEEPMKAALGDGSAFGIRLGFVRQTEPKGIAHAMGFARDFVGDDSFVMYLGDNIFGGDMSHYRRLFEESGCANLDIVCPVEDPSRYGVANVEGNRIVRLVEKPKEPESNLAMSGMYFLSPAIWEVLPDLQPSGRGEYEITDAIQLLIDRGFPVIAGVHEGPWFDTGTLDSFLETSAWLGHGETVLGDGANLVGEVGSGVVIGAGASVECARIEDSVVLPGAQIRVTGLIKHSILGGNIVLDRPISSEILWEE